MACLIISTSCIKKTLSACVPQEWNICKDAISPIVLFIDDYTIPTPCWGGMSLPLGQVPVVIE